MSPETGGSGGNSEAGRKGIPWSARIFSVYFFRSSAFDCPIWDTQLPGFPLRENMPNDGTIESLDRIDDPVDLCTLLGYD
jgi:hypothetical protein